MKKKEDERLIRVLPREKQIKWQQLEMIAFMHYGMNSFTDREWGDGLEPVSTFNPTKLDTDEWCRCLVEAGIKGMIVTAKHHDGFCLWKTKYTDYSVSSSPCETDIVGSAAQSCQKYGLKFGVYLSPWDRHEAAYGTGKEYDDYFCNQLTELLSNYGEVFEVWFDGACGEGQNGKKQYYDWERYYEVIRTLQPEAVVAICGEDVRWCGNEAGICRESEWSVVPAGMIDNEKVSEKSQKEDDEAFREEGLKSTDEDLGSRSRLLGVKELVWYPSEVDTSIRPGWFHHDAEDDKVKSLEHLMEVYFKSVGGNAVLLLNIPPHRDGYLTQEDQNRLRELGGFLTKAFQNNLAEYADVAADSCQEGYDANQILMEDDSCWMGAETQESWELTMDFGKECSISYITLMEQIRFSQRIEAFSIQILCDGIYKKVAEGTTVGYKKICRLEQPVTARCIKIRIEDARVCPTLKFVGVY